MRLHPLNPDSCLFSSSQSGPPRTSSLKSELLSVLVNSILTFTELYLSNQDFCLSSFWSQRDFNPLIRTSFLTNSIMNSVGLHPLIKTLVYSLQFNPDSHLNFREVQINFHVDEEVPPGSFPVNDMKQTCPDSHNQYFLKFPQMSFTQSSQNSRIYLKKPNGWTRS